MNGGGHRLERRITINPNTRGPSPRVTFDPNPLIASPGDQIFWTNNDVEPHWPGLVNPEGTIDRAAFMSTQIAGNGDVSSTFSTIVPATLNYACSIHPDERGVITVT